MKNIKNKHFLEVRYSCLSFLIVMLLLGVVSAPAIFAQRPPDAGSLLRDQQQTVQKLPSRLPEAVSPESSPPEMRSATEVKITLKKIRFTGAEGLASTVEVRRAKRTNLGCS